MRLSVKGLAGASGILWGAGMLVVGLANLVWPSYGGAFLNLMRSVYPGFHFTRTVGDVLVGTGYALVDGAIAGAVFAWLYNLCAGGGNR